MNYTVTLSAAQDAALSYAALSQDEWIQNAIDSRCQAAIDEIVKVAVQRSFAEGVTLPTSAEEVVLLAFEKGWVKTAEQRNVEYRAQLAALEQQP